MPKRPLPQNKDKELNGNSVIKEYLTTAADGKDYNVTYYALEMVLAIGFRVWSKRGIKFRIWANHHTDKATQMFFAETQNKLLYAVTQRTAAEIILAR